MEWIDVKEQLPESFGWFLVCDDYISTRVTMGFYEGPDSGHWLPIDSREDSDSMIITHWMPMPEPPQA